MLELLDLVKLPREFATRKPRQLSGGQKQRIGSRARLCRPPKVVVADEPVSALDVSVQAAVTELLMDIQRTSRTTMLFISHDLSIVRYIADRVVVMYLGHIVEQGTTDEIFRAALSPLHRGAAVGHSDRRHPRREAAHRARRRHSVGHEPAVRLPVPDPLRLQASRAEQPVRTRGATPGHL